MRVDEFVTTLIAGLALRDVATFSLHGVAFDNAVKHVFDVLRDKLAPAAGVDVRFRVYLDRIYGDSPSVRDSITSAMQRGLISLDDPEYQNLRILLSRREAELLADTTPGGGDLARMVADEFISNYEWVVESRRRGA